VIHFQARSFHQHAELCPDDIENEVAVHRKRWCHVLPPCALPVCIAAAAEPVAHTEESWTEFCRHAPACAGERGEAEIAL